MTREEPKKKRKGGPGRDRRHGAFSLITKGSADELPRHRRYLRPYLTGCREGWIRDLGGEENMTTSQKVLVDRAVTFLGAIRLIEEHLKDQGIFQQPGGFLHDHLTTHYLRWNRALTNVLGQLGITTKPAPELPTPLEIAAEIDAGKAREEAESGPGIAQGKRSPAGRGKGKARKRAKGRESGPGGEKGASHFVQEGRTRGDEGQGPGPDGEGCLQRVAKNTGSPGPGPGR